MLSVITLALAITSCGGVAIDNEHAALVMKQINTLHQGLGMRDVKPNWYYCGRLKHENRCYMDNWKIILTNGYIKSVEYNMDMQALKEGDYYYSGNKYRTCDGEFGEHVTIRYDYKTHAYEVYYAGTNSTIADEIKKAHRTKEMQEKLKIIDLVLLKWGLSRL